MRPLEAACPTCAQQPSEVCVDQYRIPLSYYHASRVEAAFFASGGEGETPSSEEFERAVDETGLI